MTQLAVFFTTDLSSQITQTLLICQQVLRYCVSLKHTDGTANQNLRDWTAPLDGIPHQRGHSPAMQASASSQTMHARSTGACPQPTHAGNCHAGTATPAVTATQAACTPAQHNLRERAVAWLVILHSRDWDRPVAWLATPHSGGLRPVDRPSALTDSPLQAPRLPSLLKTGQT